MAETKIYSKSGTENSKRQGSKEESKDRSTMIIPGNQGKLLPH
jgi:hypothetical protein